MIETTSLVKIPRSWPQRNNQTLFYDAIYINETDVVLVGPPLDELKTFIEQEVKFFDHEGRNLPMLIQEMDQVCEIILCCEVSPSFVRVAGPKIDGVQEVINITPNLGQSPFRNKRVLVSLQRDNPIEWIDQWIEFHEVEHDIDAALIYDGGTTAYDPADISKLSRLGISVHVVRWNDSSRAGALEHAKLRYLHSADLVINADISELLLTNKPIDAMMNDLGTDCLIYDGRWVVQDGPPRPFSKRRFHDYAGMGSQGNPVAKWCLRPNAELVQQQWKPHHVEGAAVAANKDDIVYANFRAMRVDWSLNKEMSLIREWGELREALNRVFEREKRDEITEIAAKLLPKHFPLL